MSGGTGELQPSIQWLNLNLKQILFVDRTFCSVHMHVNKIEQNIKHKSTLTRNMITQSAIWHELIHEHLQDEPSTSQYFVLSFFFQIKFLYYEQTQNEEDVHTK
jgi:hypothetical protein